MHEKVAAYLKEQREKEAAAGSAARQETLLRLGLWEKEYAPEGETNLALYKETDENGRSWRKVPIPVTDEEWAEIVRCADGKRGKMAWALLVLAGFWYFWAGARLFTGRLDIQMLSGLTMGTALLALEKILRSWKKG